MLKGGSDYLIDRVGKDGSSIPLGVSFAVLVEESVGRAASFGGVNASGGGDSVSVEGPSSWKEQRSRLIYSRNC